MPHMKTAPVISLPLDAGVCVAPAHVHRIFKFQYVFARSMFVFACVFFQNANAGGNSFGVISFRFSVKMPCVVVQGELS